MKLPTRLLVATVVASLTFSGAFAFADGDDPKDDPSPFDDDDPFGLDDDPLGPDDPDAPGAWPPLPHHRFSFRNLQAKPSSESKVVWSLADFENRARVTRRIAFVIDVSGTMSGNEMRKAREIIEFNLRQFPDDGLFKIYAFSDNVDVFNGDTVGYERATDRNPDTEADENGWIRMPNFEVLDKASAWLCKFSGSGNTYIESGVKQAMDENPEDDLSVVLISDGDATNFDTVVLGKISGWAKARKIVVHAICIGWLKSGNSTGEMLMSDIAKATGGSYESWKQTAADTDEDTPDGPH